MGIIAPCPMMGILGVIYNGRAFLEGPVTSSKGDRSVCVDWRFYVIFMLIRNLVDM